MESSSKEALPNLVAHAQLPEWVQWASALGPTIVAALVAYVAWRQWRTAHNRQIIDLFDLRLGAYEEIFAVVGKVLLHGSVNRSYPEEDLDWAFTVREFDRASRHVKFLFGEEVESYVKETRGLLQKIGLAEESREKYPNWATEKNAGLEKLAKFYTAFPKLCRPYMKMDTKGVRWFWA